MELDPQLREQLIERAREVAGERGWTWREPIEVSRSAEGGEAVWLVRSNVMSRGQNAVIVFRQSDLGLVRAGYLPR
ncbi:MAG TPA: hypothetical protein VH325_16860 [Bryobacteraceae bacterium]|jgi:hypothetical protein|nr:hypothetical protein [Bryobacteraceae bacterium]